MNDALLVRGFQRVGDLLRDRQRVGRAGSAPRAMRSRQVVALDQFHHERRARRRLLLEAVDGARCSDG